MKNTAKKKEIFIEYYMRVCDGDFMTFYLSHPHNHDREWAREGNNSQATTNNFFLFIYLNIFLFELLQCLCRSSDMHSHLIPQQTFSEDYIKMQLPSRDLFNKKKYNSNIFFSCTHTQHAQLKKEKLWKLCRDSRFHFEY
jgi:hypothetical protein